jgi:hypothetical protein
MIAFFIVLTVAVILGMSGLRNRNGMTALTSDGGVSSTSQDNSGINNLELQNACIANAKATDESNPLLYDPLPLGSAPPGMTLAGQMALQKQVADCQLRYPVN